ncbi:ribosome maturation factor RimM [Thermocoleostomius sinensis]|jgi:16S rRNA processing protein RimM|uniref:Ribosome maturation factor RimM n=1 Tax=Thermocoleostomius sinensis A174 TaxID=2016057 RepID=A0A9E9C9D6_9CYAN|nr:ribosome maturation factor RimM [Thermocoleostomius sinensis]WAL62554.1 ribosome maturation factor RimM [Thermocoleostomius sinensis A174]
MSEWLEIGKIVGVQGVKGEVRIYPNTDFPERFEQSGTRWLLRPGKADPEPIDLLSGRYLPNKGLYVVSFAGITDRNQAEQLRDCRLLVPEADRPKLDEDEYHVLDLLNLTVFDQATQTSIGTVTDVIAAGNDLLEVKLHVANTSATVLIPFVKAIVPVVDLVQKRIEITPPPGLIEL